jgi:hypothetical protein
MVVRCDVDSSPSWILTKIAFMAGEGINGYIDGVKQGPPFNPLDREKIEARLFIRKMPIASLKDCERKTTILSIDNLAKRRPTSIDGHEASLAARLGRVVPDSW